MEQRQFDSVFCITYPQERPVWTDNISYLSTGPSGLLASALCMSIMGGATGNDNCIYQIYIYFRLKILANVG